MNKVIGFVLAGVLGVFFGSQVLGAAIVFWPVTLLLAYWFISGRP